MTNTEEAKYLEKFEAGLLDDLLRLCKSLKALDDTLLESEDINGRWEEYAAEYLSDAIGQINDFPEAAIAWAGFTGMAVAHHWDSDWENHCQDPYITLHGARGFDDMDEHIMRDIMHIDLNSPTAEGLTRLMLACAQAVLDKIRHENIEAQSKRAFYVYAIAVKVMYRIGASVELKRLGYRFEKVDLNTLKS